MDYLTDRPHFVQIDSNISNIFDKSFGVQQGSILGLVFLNLYVADMKSILNGSKCIQYADDYTIYRSCEIKHINKCSNEIESEWSKDTNFIFNPNKTKVIAISSRQMAQYHQLDSSNKVNIKFNNKNIERVKEEKQLGITLDELSELHSHANKLFRFTNTKTIKT